MAFDVLALKPLSPPYSAVIECVAADSDVVEKLTCPVALSASGPARTVLPSLTVIVPPRGPDPGATARTVAVKVTDWPKVDGFTDDVTLVVVVAFVTMCEADGLVLAL